jgi:signal transduction histidine kinase
MSHRREALEFVGRPLPSAIAAVAIGLLLLLMPAPSRDYGLVAVSAVLGLGVIALSLAWRRHPRAIGLAVPLGYLVFAVVLRQSAGGGSSGFGGLLLLPVLWLALSARRQDLLIGLAAMAAALFGPLVVLGAPDYPSNGWRAGVVLLSVAAVFGITIQALVERARMYAAESLRRQSALEEANSELARKNRLQADFVALAAHELRTPVATIYGFAMTLDRHADRLTTQQASDLKHTLAAESHRMTQLVERLLDLSRIDAEAVEIHPTRVKVRETVETMLPLAAGERLPDIRLEIPVELEATIDVAVLDRILSNLVTNATRYGEPPIVVEARRDDGHLRITVEDHGRGIPEHFVPSMFERFTRSNDAPDKAAGTGLGLAIARSYARAHHGDLVYERRDPKVTRFQLVLPTS